MKRFFATILAFAAIAAADITLSKDSLRVYNNPVMSSTDGLTLKNTGGDTVWLDSAQMLFDEFDTTGLSMFLKNSTIEATWLEQYAVDNYMNYTWKMNTLDGKKYRLESLDAASAGRKSLTTAPDDSTRLSRLEIGWCFVCSSMPRYPRYLRGVVRLWFSSAATVDVRITSEDLRPMVPYEPCSDYTCDSMNVRKILDRNGMPGVPVDAVSSVAGGRIASLSFSYNLLTASSLPKPVTVLPHEVGNLTALRNIGASGNTIDTIAPQIGRCSNLSSLFMNNNGISDLPDSIVRCSRLITIDLDNNRLTRLPDSMGMLKSLRQFSITSNHLASLPESMVKLDSIDCVFIAGNRICTLPDGVIGWMEYIRKQSKCARFDPVWPDSQECGTASAERGTIGNRAVAAGVRVMQSGDELTVETGIRSSFYGAVVLLDLSGRRVREAALPGIHGSGIKLSTCGLSRGIYLLAVAAEGAKVPTRLVIVK